ncbi:MAG: YciI family protein [Gemmatimonadales bacterium]
MTIVKSRETSAQPSSVLIDRINQLAEDATQQGVFGGMGGLGPTALGARARLANGKITVTDGPFAEAKEIIGGYAIFDVKSKKEALEWTQRFLEAHIGLWDEDMEVEVRQMMDAPETGC